MKCYCVVLGLCVFLACCLPAVAQKGTRPMRVVIETSLGNIEVQLEPQKAPLTTANFLRYVDGGFYNGGVFYRTVTADNQPDKKTKIEVIQGGVDPASDKKRFPPIPLERTNHTGLHHTDGTISMARDVPDSATSEFFICIGDQPSLDYGGARNPDGQGFAAFGHVIKGMDIVRRIQMSPAQGQALTPPVRILEVRRT